MMRDRLLELCRRNGVSGFEEPVREMIRAWAAPYADEIREDPAGNLMVYKKGTRGGRTVMVAAHMDEVGFLIKGINEDGTLRFVNVGRIINQILPAMRVVVGERAIPGVISMIPPHMGKRGQVYGPGELAIDIGAKDRAAAEKLTYPGDFAAFAGEPQWYGEDVLKAKALDDRLGCAVMLELMQEELPCDTWFVFTVQEEIGSGAVTAARRIHPDIGLVLECTSAGDLPYVEGALRTCAYGGGAVIPLADGGAVYDPALVRLARSAADAAGIPWQEKTSIAGITDAKPMAEAGGAAVLAISAPGRYIHSPISSVKWTDAEAVLGAAKAFLMAL